MRYVIHVSDLRNNWNPSTGLQVFQFEKTRGLAVSVIGQCDNLLTCLRLFHERNDSKEYHYRGRTIHKS